MKKKLVLIFLTIILQSCSIFNFSKCKNYHSDSQTFRTFAEAIGANPQLAEEKALLTAKKLIAKNIDDYVANLCDYQTFLSDSEYENKLTTARNIAISNIEIICLKTSKKGEMYKSQIAIEVSKDDVDKEIANRLKK